VRVLPETVINLIAGVIVVVGVVGVDTRGVHTNTTMYNSNKCKNKTKCRYSTEHVVMKQYITK